MLKEIFTPISFLIVGVLLMYFKNKIFTGAKKTIKKGIKAKYTKNGKEIFKVNKLKKMYILNSAVEWTKSIKEMIDLRKIIIWMTIAGIVFGYGWWKGTQGKPVKIDLRYGKETKLILNGEMLHIDKKGNVFLRDAKTEELIKQLSVKDVPGLRKKLRPYGFKLEPFILGGGGINEKGDMGLEVGAGVSLIRVWKTNLDAFLTNRGVYGGISYKITDNSGIGLGVGKGWNFDSRAIIYYKFKF